MDLYYYFLFAYPIQLFDQYNRPNKIKQAKIKQSNKMKLRSDRTHYMGTSNRQFNHNLDRNGIGNVFDRSFNKSKQKFISKSIFVKSNSQIMENNNKIVKDHVVNMSSSMIMDKSKINRYADPFMGSHHELQTTRFDKNNFKLGNQSNDFGFSSQRSQQTKQKQLSMSHILNKEIRDIRQQFSLKSDKVNMHKIKSLKQTFVKNNRNVRNFKDYFNKYASNSSDKEQFIDEKGLKKLVKQYGFDLNQQQCKLIFKLTQKANNPECASEQTRNYINLDQFVELMTREDVYYKTLRLTGQQEKKTANIITQKQEIKKNFPDKIHQVLRNKFPKLKQALQIYRQRNQKITKKQYENILKKLDITELILRPEEKQQIFKEYSNLNNECLSSNGQLQLNAQKLLCAIAQQQYKNKQLINRGTYQRFQQQIDANKQIKFAKMNKMRDFALKNLSSLEYLNQITKARRVIQQLQKLRRSNTSTINRDKQSDVLKSIICTDLNINKQGAYYTSKQQLVKGVETLLKKQGISFHRQQYDAFGAYLNYDANGHISYDKFKHIVFFQTEKQAQQRFERKVRCQQPIKQTHKIVQNIDSSMAYRSLKKIRQHKLNPETRQLFKHFDKDNDGYISIHQFQDNLANMNILSRKQIQNLGAYLQIKEKGFIGFRDFAQKYGIENNNDDDNPQNNSSLDQLPYVNMKTRNSKSCYNWSQITKTKKQIIRNMQSNQTFYQRPTKYSAWPKNLQNKDFSLIQAPEKTDSYISEFDRFNSKIQDYAMKEKLMQTARQQNRIQKICEWNNIIKDRMEKNEQRQQNKIMRKNYLTRLTRQEYQLKCHQ